MAADVVLYVAQRASASRATVIAEWRKECGESCSHPPITAVPSQAAHQLLQAP